MRLCLRSLDKVREKLIVCGHKIPFIPHSILNVLIMKKISGRSESPGATEQSGF